MKLKLIAKEDYPTHKIIVLGSDDGTTAMLHRIDLVPRHRLEREAEASLALVAILNHIEATP